MTLYSLRLAITYEFDRPAGAGRQLFRIMPATIAGVQMVHKAKVVIAPEPNDQASFSDFFGTEVIEAAIAAGQTSLSLVLSSEVERLGQLPLLDSTPPLTALAAEVAAIRDVGPEAPHHYLAATARIPEVPAISAFARSVARKAGDCSALRLVEELGKALHRYMRFDAEATDVDTTPEQAFTLRRGVCQDYAQIMVGGLRALGVPAAYVAGYLRTYPPPGKPRLQGADAMHAWVRAWVGADRAWVEYDPTNACFALSDHIDIGFGRDYSDVAPITGMLRMDGSQTGRHTVDIEEIL